MKKFIEVFTEKLKEVEAQWVALGTGVLTLVALLGTISIVKGLFNMITTIVEILANGGSQAVG